MYFKWGIVLYYGKGCKYGELVRKGFDFKNKVFSLVIFSLYIIMWYGVNMVVWGYFEGFIFFFIMLDFRF